MPTVEGQLLTPEDAVGKGLCPECGGDLKATNARAHRNMHWRADPPRDKRGDGARKRQEILDKYIEDNDVRTTNMPQPKAAKPADLP